MRWPPGPRHLFLTCLFNIEEENRKVREYGIFAEWKDVVARMQWLGFGYSTVLEAGEHFMASAGEPPGAIRFVRQELNVGTIAETAASPVMLTPLGRECVTTVLEKIGYVWGVAHRAGFAGKNEESYFDFSARQRARQVYEFVKDLARKHLRLLTLLGREKTGEVDWLRLYRARFAVRGLLQCERILSSADAFYGHLFADELEMGGRAVRSPFQVMRDAYTEMAGRVGDGVDESGLEWNRLSEGDGLWEETNEEASGEGHSDEC